MFVYNFLSRRHTCLQRARGLDTGNNEELAHFKGKLGFPTFPDEAKQVEARASTIKSSASCRKDFMVS